MKTVVLATAMIMAMASVAFGADRGVTLVYAPTTAVAGPGCYQIEVRRPNGQLVWYGLPIAEYEVPEAQQVAEIAQLAAVAPGTVIDIETHAFPYTLPVSNLDYCFPLVDPAGNANVPLYVMLGVSRYLPH